MKTRHRTVIALALVMLCATASFAGEISFGPKAGLAISNVTGVPKEWEDDKSFVPGFAGGVALNYAFNESFSLQPELLYVGKGVGGNLYEGIISVDVTADLSYVEIPVLARYAFLPGKSFRPCVFAGPAVAYCIGSELDFSAGFLSADVDIGSLTHVSDFSLVAGAGFECPIGGHRLTFDARFERGFTNVIMSGDFEVNGSVQTIDVDDFKNYGFVFMAGYMF